MEFYERMRELRKEHGETQAQVAAAAGMTDRQYQRFETGKQKPGFDSLLALADHFGVSLDYLAGRSDRASKSMLVNTDRISSIASISGSRGKIMMDNGEAIIASRMYYKSLLSSMKWKKIS